MYQVYSIKASRRHIRVVLAIYKTQKQPFLSGEERICGAHSSPAARMPTIPAPSPPRAPRAQLLRIPAANSPDRLSPSRSLQPAT
uniref:Uncharacterized protein n=1 Tax=Oryza nivara TaxID=4536 RepID=A0A0E0FK70_ORYNI